MITFTVNGAKQEIEVDPTTPLAWVLRDKLRLTGTKISCAAGLCGSCTVHVDGDAMRSCVLPVGSIAGRTVLTIEGLAADANDPVVRAWIAHDVVQCGYCQPGFIMATAALLRSNPHPSEAQILSAVTNLCRCGTYVRIRQAIDLAIKLQTAGVP